MFSPLVQPLRYLVLLTAFFFIDSGNPAYAQCGGPVPVICDADADRDVDVDDIDAITNAAGTLAAPGDMRDIDGDGWITEQDAQQCTAQCEFSDCGNLLDKPNILVLMADDLGFNDLAINNGNTAIDTPNMDQLARDGVRFTRHYAAAVCSPARAAFLTGMYPERLGYLPNGRGMTPEVVTMAERLGKAGYTTWHIGKWHIGDLERRAWPDYQGFDHWFGFLNQWRLEGLHVDGELQLGEPRYFDPWLQGDTEPGRRFTGHLEDILTDKAIEVLTELEAAQAPWFLNLWFYAPHVPIDPAPAYASLYPATSAGRYQALVHQLDTNIGRIVSHLGDIGALQDTIIVVVSDNGGTNALLNNNYPYVGKKTQTNEGGLRTPLIIKWPDETLNGRVFEDIVSIEDIYPTLMAAIELAFQESHDGNSFYDSITQQAPVVQKDRFNESGALMYGGLTADGGWRLYQPPPLWGVGVAPKMYDLVLDPTGGQQVVPSPEPELAMLLDSYQTWYRDVHTVEAEYVTTAYGGVLSGMSFMRTPGFGQYTIGVGISDDYEGQIAAQNGIWKIERTATTVIAQFGDLILSGDIASADSCHSIVVTGSFSRRLSNQSSPETINLSLYIDDNEVQSGSIESTLPVSNPKQVTVIGDPDNPGQTGSVGEPVILNVRLDRPYSPWTVESFSQEVCAGL